MIRRSFRVGLRLGLLIGITFAVVKTVQSRRASAPGTAPPEPWQPARPTPDRPVDEVGEPVMEPAGPGRAAPAPAPPTPPEKQLLATDAGPAGGSAAKSAPLKKAATKKKAAAAKTAAPAKKAAKRGGRMSAWVEPVGGACPPTHPVKAKVASKLFHLPGMFAYDRTRPDRCYLDQPAAEGDGFTRAKR